MKPDPKVIMGLFKSGQIDKQTALELLAPRSNTLPGDGQTATVAQREGPELEAVSAVNPPASAVKNGGPSGSGQPTVDAAQPEAGRLAALIQQDLVLEVSRQLKLAPEELDPASELDEDGFDSITLHQFALCLAEV